jgi:hypothetical protein
MPADVDIRQAFYQLANGLDVCDGLIPRNVRNGAQHGIEHKQARFVSRAERAADRSIRVCDKGDGLAVLLGEFFQDALRRPDDTAEYDAILVEMNIAKKLVQLIVCRAAVSAV